ncbi:MAG: glutamate--tRNA ligase [Pseudanabaenaceae cyanobacterium]
MTVRVRIAPSPTGNLHIGTARTALFNWLYARRHGGTFILRIEDTDRERSREEYVQNILTGLAWLGLNFDEGPFFQTQRLPQYRAAVQRLLDRGLAYLCYCSEAELEALREAQRAQKLAPRYDNRHRHLTPAQRAAYEAEGRRPVVRFRIEEPREVVWQDLVRGEIRWQTQDLGGDMVIARVEADGTIGLPLYNFAVVVDDLDMGITHVVRGEDHIANTAKQILLYEALGAQPPAFGHLPLILNAQGAKISKRDGATSVDEFRQMGFLPQAFTNYMVLLGWSPPDGQELFDMATAAQQFDFDRVNKAGARFDWDKLDWINGQYLRALSPEDLLTAVLPFWQAAGWQEDDRPWLLDLVTLLGPGLTRLTDAVAAAAVYFADTVSFADEALAIARDHRHLLADFAQTFEKANPQTVEEADALLKAFAKEQGVKKGALMRPLRCALMGSLHGPDLLQSLMLLHRKGKAIPRLQGIPA